MEGQVDCPPKGVSTPMLRTSGPEERGEWKRHTCSSKPEACASTVLLERSWPHKISGRFGRRAPPQGRDDAAGTGSLFGSISQSTEANHIETRRENIPGKGERSNCAIVPELETEGQCGQTILHGMASQTKQEVSAGSLHLGGSCVGQNTRCRFCYM